MTGQRSLKESTSFLKNKQENERHELLAGGFGFKSAHVLINKERVRRGRCCLKRNFRLDTLCQEHADTMARDTTVSHSVQSIDELKALVNSDEAGQNVQSGESVEAMHNDATQASKRHESAFANMIGKNFLEFGTATAKGTDGKLYMVQLFRGAVADEESEPTVVDMGDFCSTQQPKTGKALHESTASCDSTCCSLTESNTSIES